ncbi:MAG: phosphoribosylamine--glycine ligase [Planctomycetaceae bacterium]|jgi:phosphoribosylamine---glycine ligase|nr:phosphoribosylamine--glycine ligase [Planctomycetaceae bacterium]MBT6484503.1 phosphoribosylamine--glycine ligase [Planctomycetaceae bacterium]
MKVLVIGQGGREHALVWKLAQSASVDEVFCAPGNAGTGEDGTNVDISGTDATRLVKFAKDNQIGLTVVGPEVPLMAGVADAFLDAGLPVFGPRAAAAELEGSKVFSKQLMQHANVPTADFQVFKHADAAQSYLQDREATSFVVKADGLAAGKGVIVCSSRSEALRAIETIMVERAFGDAGDRVIIEERLVGEEVSILAMVQGKTIIPLETAQDHKPAYDGDLGPNTGGMGAYSPTPLVTPELMDNIVSEVLVPTVHALKKDGREFCGILYAGLMICGDTPKVLEYNVRFGDPEAQPVLMRLKSDLAEVLLAAAEGRLAEIPALEWDQRPAICVVMASDGYPGDYEKGRPIRGLEDAAALEDVKVFHAGTIKQGNQILTNGGRVLGVTAMGDTIAAAKLRAYQAVKCIRWDGAWCRKDISDKARD